MSALIEVEGYVIVPPLSPWDEKNASVIYGDICRFGTSPEDAWARWIGPLHDPVDRPERVQRWFNAGYRLRKATLIIATEPTP